MTRKEVIDELKKIDTLSLPNGYLGKMDEALNIAINFLQTEPKEITMEDVETYCKQRNLIVITKELFDDMSKLADKIYLHLKDKEYQKPTHNCYTCKYYSIEHYEEPCKTCIEEQSIKNMYPKYIQKE